MRRWRGFLIGRNLVHCSLAANPESGSMMSGQTTSYVQSLNREGCRGKIPNNRATQELEVHLLTVEVLI